MNIHHEESDENYKAFYNQLSDSICSKTQDKKGRKRKNLAVRSDVMNKNIIRAIKRESKRMFDNFVELKKLSKTAAFFDQNVEEFVQYLFESTQIFLAERFKKRDL